MSAGSASANFGALRLKSVMLRGVSLAALAILVPMAPAQAQLAARRGVVVSAPVLTPAAVPRAILSSQMTAALEGSVAGQTRADNIRAYVAQARSAAAANVRPVPANGLTPNGLVVATGVTAQALAAGALQAARDATGRATWQGAALPVETATSDGKSLVTITQNESRAILSWNRFDVGSNTVVQFDQKLNGVGQQNWVALNRVVGPTAPSTILGSIKADGTVVVLNQRGIVFGNGAQVDLHSLLASSLEIGNFSKVGLPTFAGSQRFTGLTLQERNRTFVENGLLTEAVKIGDATLLPSLTSAQVDAGNYLTDATTVNLALVGSAGPYGSVEVDRGASITSNGGGFVIFTAPKIVNDGKLSAPEGQISLQSGLAVGFTPSTGSDAVDTNVRGLILRSPYGASGTVENTGLIDVPRGYISLGAGLDGSVTNAGLLSSTTSVSRNGKISLTAGTVNLSGAQSLNQAGGIVILPDASLETVPQGTATQPPKFKTSEIEIGGIYFPQTAFELPLGRFSTSEVSIGKNALILAPNADVNIGGRSTDSFDAFAFRNQFGTDARGNITISAGALIDVGGVKDVTLDASRNSLLIDPLKRNELRDTPGYREPATNGDFTLNGVAVYVDPRITGVRADGVAYTGSPLLEAGSAASQIGIGAAELMTKGGNINLSVGILDATSDPLAPPRIRIDALAAIDFSGGWVRFNEGIVRSSRLLTADGRIVDLGVADPNDEFVAIGDGFTEIQAKFGVSRTYANSLLQGGRFEAAYTEGRDAGSLFINASTATVDGALRGEAFAGLRQRTSAQIGSATSSLIGDVRKLQGTAQELPSGGYLKLGSTTGKSQIGLGADIIVYDGTKAAPTARYSEFLLSDGNLNAAGLSAISLQTTGAVTFSLGSSLNLVGGAALNVDAGRTISFDGDIVAPSGTISARTYEFGSVLGVVVRGANGLSASAIGSPFRSAVLGNDDDLSAQTIGSTDTLAPFDVKVNGLLSTAGLWVNDFNNIDENGNGAAWTSGGSIRLAVAPRVLVQAPGSPFAIDLSGSILIAPNALLNVSSGGYVAPDGKLNLSATGGNVSLVNETTYAAVVKTAIDPLSSGAQNSASFPIFGQNQTVDFTPLPAGFGGINEQGVVPSLVPEIARATVSFAESSIKGFGFGGGGTFTLVAPDIAFGSATASPVASHIGLDFLAKTGFGALDLSTMRSKLVSHLFNNGRTGNSAFFETTRFVIGRDERLDLTQTLLPTLLTADETRKLALLDSGSDITKVLSPVVPIDPFDQMAATLRLGGLTELDIAAGGLLTGAAGAGATFAKLDNAGDIRIAGGRLTQVSELPDAFASRTIGVRDLGLGGAGLAEILGDQKPGGSFDENAKITRNVRNSAGQHVSLTNRELFALGGSDQTVYFLGQLGADEGIRLELGSVTDLSGTVLYNPLAPIFRTGERQLTGRVIGGGTIETAAAANFFRTFFSDPRYSNERYLLPGDPNRPKLTQQTLGLALIALPGSNINISGASATFDQRGAGGAFEKVLQYSNAGRLSALSGGSIAGSVIKALGGDDVNFTGSGKAEGGILEWRAPVLRGTDGGVRADNILFADQIEKSGFDTLVARGSVAVEGSLDLSLDKAFLLSSAPATRSRPEAADLVTSVRVGSGANATITAPYINLSSGAQNAAGLLTSVPTGTSGSLTFRGKAIDLVGGVALLTTTGNGKDRATIGGVSFKSAGDIRLTGVRNLPNADGTIAPGLTGQIVSSGNISFEAGQVYATTGTGNLQQRLEDLRAGLVSSAVPYTIASINGLGTISFARAPGNTPDLPLSAGTYVRILGNRIDQNGVVRAPLGLLEIGSNVPVTIAPGRALPATVDLTFGPQSKTSVSGVGLSVPYGTTTDLTENFLLPVTNTILATSPVGALELSGGNIVVAASAEMDGRGGGDVFSYEFISGTGGSRDVLDRLNPDIFSGNDGLQYADGRQVFAIIPKAQGDLVAKYDPIYAADYGSGSKVDLYGLSAGRSVVLDAAPGIAAGEYLLLPAHYALLPGALRVVENIGADIPDPGSAATLRDGSIVVGGVFGTAGTGLADSKRRSFTLQSRDTFSQYSRIETKSVAEAVAALADKKSLLAPRSPLDAARVVLSPIKTLTVAGEFLTSPGTDEKMGTRGRGAQFDIGGLDILIARPGTATTANQLLLTTDTIAKLNANSLLIGAVRTDQLDGSSNLNVLANQISIDGKVGPSDSGDFSLRLPEIVLAVGGTNSALTVNDGAAIVATGTLDDTRSGDYIISEATGIGSVLRVANGVERLVARTGADIAKNSLRPSILRLGSVTLSGDAIALDTSRNFVIDRDVILNAKAIALSGDVFKFSNPFINPKIQAQLAQTDRVTLRSPDVIGFASGDYVFKDLRIDAPGIGYANIATDQIFAVNIAANNVELGNSGRDLGGCIGSGARACGDSGVPITLDAAGSVIFGAGTLRTYGFDAGVTINAAKGMYVAGAGGLLVDNPDAPRFTALTLNTPFLVERASVADPRAQTVRPDYAFQTTGDFVLSGSGSQPGILPTGNAAPGARISIGTAASRVRSATISDAYVRATAGVIDIRADDLLSLAGNASLQTPGYSKTFGSGQDTVTVSSGGGSINLVAHDGNVETSEQSSIIVDNGVGQAGKLSLFATNAEVILKAVLNPGIVAGALRTSSFQISSAASAFDFARFVADNGRKFGGAINIYAGDGDLKLNLGQTLRAQSLRLAAENGIVDIDGTIDTSGGSVAGLTFGSPDYRDVKVDGGDINLFGANGVAIGSSGKLIATTSGYASEDTRTATAGDVTLGISREDASVSLAPGSQINVAALRPGNRLVADSAKDAVTLISVPYFRAVEGDKGGIVTFRAPTVGTGGYLVDVRNAGTITGASSTDIEAFKRYDLVDIASRGNFSGVSFDQRDNISLDASAKGKPNFLSDVAPGTIPDFIQNFRVAARNGDSLASYNRLRPGVELFSATQTNLDSNWNLGAGVITNYAQAETEGLLVKSPLGPYANGDLRYQVVLGKEGDLFQRFVKLTYRVGSSVFGEAPVVTLRSSGDLEIKNSITDGFFAFHDKTDPDYISYQLGGGNRTYQPALNQTCGADTEACTAVALYSDVATGAVAATARNTVGIALLTAQRGTDAQRYIYSPYTASANAPGARGAGVNGAGDPLGVSELFPSIQDAHGNSFVSRSSSFRFVGGAGDVSVDPLHVNVSLPGSVKVSGETSYNVTALAGTANRFGGPLQLIYRNVDVVPATFDSAIANVEDFVDARFSADPLAAQDFATTLTWGSSATGVANDARLAAQAFFKNRTFTGTRLVKTGVVAPLSEVIAFLSQSGFGDDYVRNLTAAGSTYGRVNTSSSQFIANFSQDKAYVGTIIRTGDGSIDVSAANNIDLANRTPFLISRTKDGAVRAASSDNAQVGGTAIYTAGQRSNVSIIGNAAVERLDFVPSPKREFDAAPILAQNGGGVSLAAGASVLGRRDVWAEAFLGNAAAEAQYNRVQFDNRVLATPVFLDPARYGSSDQRWRVGQIGQNSQILIVPELFTSGVAALAGGNVTVSAGNAVNDLTIALDNSVYTDRSGTPTLFSYGHGNLSVETGADLLGGQFDVASGTAAIRVGGNVTNAGKTLTTGSFANGDARNLLRLRVSNATLDLTANGTVDVAGIGALGVGNNDNADGFFTPVAGASVTSNGALTLSRNRVEQFASAAYVADSVEKLSLVAGQVLPPSLSLVSTQSDIIIPTAAGQPPVSLLYPSRVGQLRLVAGRDLSQFGLAMIDADPSDVPGAFSISNVIAPGNVVLVQAGLGFTFPGVFPNTSEARRRLLHNRDFVNSREASPVEIYAGGDISNAVITVAKQARISAGRDLTNLYFDGQNLSPSDNTRVSAGRDITGTAAVSALTGLSVVQGNTFILGGAGNLFVEAGRDLGPFLSSSGINADVAVGGIRTVGNEFNPWLDTKGANIYAFFGVGKGANYTALRDVYLNPANLAALSGDLFEQNSDAFGNKSPDRTRPIYAPILAQWLRQNEPAAFAAAFGAPPANDAELATRAYSKFAALYDAFSKLDPLRQQTFLLDKVYFAELAAPARPVGSNYFTVRDTYLNPANLAGLSSDLFEQNVDALGNKVPDRTRPIYAPILARFLRDTEPAAFARVFASAPANDADLTAAAYAKFGDLYTAFSALDAIRQQAFLRDSNYFGPLAALATPGGQSYLQYIRSYRAIETLFPASAGYTDNLATYNIDPTTGVATKKLDANGNPAVATRKLTGNVDLRLSSIQTARGGDISIVGPGGDFVAGSLVRTETQLARKSSAILAHVNGDFRTSNLGGTRIPSIPLGAEGILTLRGGGIRSFTDGDLRLNQSRLFTLRGGDITLFSANGDLNAGQGPKSASNFPPIAVKFDLNGFAELDSAGSVAGAGIAAFRPTPETPASNVTLLAPVGTVDAGDAGVRASGNVFVAAARVANADNFKVGGQAFGVPTLGVVAAPALPAGATSAISAQLAKVGDALNAGDRESRIFVDVLGYLGGKSTDCPDGKSQDANGQCPAN